MPKRTTTVAFEESLDRRFRLFSEVSKIPLTRIVSEAVDAYIELYLEDNEGVKVKYDAEEAKMIASAGVSLIKPRKPKISERKMDASKEDSK